MGSGLVNANRMVDIASGGAGFYVSPQDWIAGSYDGQNYPGFTNILKAGESSDNWLTVTNTSDNWLYLNAGDRWLQKTTDWRMDWTSSPVSDEAITLVEDDPGSTDYDINMPNYIWNITDQIPADTDVAVFRRYYSFDQFDPEQSYDWQQTNMWQPLIYDWTDLNGDGIAWHDDNGDGTVQPEEFETGELVRFDYSNNYGPATQVSVQQPLERMHDGIFIGLQHRGARADVPQTAMTLGLDFYQQQDFSWLDIDSTLAVAPHSDARIKASVHVPGDAPAGIYEGAVWLNDGVWNTTVPVTINVAGRGYNLTGGGNVGEGWYDNGQIYGLQSWSWRPESGDWRFYYADLGDNPAGLNRLNGTEYWMVQASWDNLPTDLNIHMFGPTADDFSGDEPDYYGPYTLEPIGGSNTGYAAAGAFRTQTSSGGSTEFVGAPYVPGLNFIAIDNVNYDGTASSEPFSLQAGVISVSQSPIEVTRSSANGQFSTNETIVSTMALDGLIVDGYGLSKPDVETGQTVNQDDPNDPSTSSYTKEIHLDHAGKLDVSIDGQDGTDLDLYLLYDANGDGQFDFGSEGIAASTTGTPDEAVSLTLPADGDYLVAVHGWSVPQGTTTFDLSVNAVQGDSFTISGVPSGAVQSGQRYTFTIDMDAAGYEPGTYSGLIAVGPPQGPAAILIPVTVNVTE
jgi:hypothetical protein